MVYFKFYFKLFFFVADHNSCLKINDPTPATPWTKTDMFGLMMVNYQQHKSQEKSQDVETLWCMMATKPSDYQHVGYSFENNGHRGFGLFTR